MLLMGGDCRPRSRALNGQLVLDCWSMSHWAAVKAWKMFEKNRMDVLASQETHPAVMPL